MGRAATIAGLVGFASAQNASVAECKDFSETLQGEIGVGPGVKDDTCWNHMEWAIKTGLKKNPDWYPVGTEATPTDVQCALYLMSLVKTELRRMATPAISHHAHTSPRAWRMEPLSRQ